MKTHYEVEMLFFNSGWENCWKVDDDEPQTFETFDDALAELNCHLAEMEEAEQEGFIEDYAPAHDYRIVKVTRETVHQYGAARS